DEVAKEFNVPVQFQRYWIWAKRQNHTYRPNRPLTPAEEAQSVGQLREVSNKVHNAELKLFLEVEMGMDSCPIAPPEKTKDDILLFFKLYDPEKEELRYVGRIFVKCTGKPLEILSRLNEMAGYDPEEDIALYERADAEAGSEVGQLSDYASILARLADHFLDPLRSSPSLLSVVSVLTADTCSHHSHHLCPYSHLCCSLFLFYPFSLPASVCFAVLLSLVVLLAAREIKFEPNVMCEPIDKKVTFRTSQVIIYCQLLAVVAWNCQDVAIGDYMSWKMVISYAFRRLLLWIVGKMSDIQMCPHIWNMCTIARSRTTVTPTTNVIVQLGGATPTPTWARLSFSVCLQTRLCLVQRYASDTVVHAFDVVHFRSLDRPKEDDFFLEMSRLFTYDDVVERVAQQLGLHDPSKIRLTPHNCYSQQPKPQPIKYRGVEHLSDMLVHYNQTSDILYYEVLDIPLPELQGLKTLKVAFHHAIKDEVVIHTIRLPKQSTVGDVLDDLKTKVELSDPEAELRLLEVFYHKIYKVFPPNEKIENINDQYWTLRAEEIPEEEKNLGSHDRLIHVYHFTKDTAQNQMQIQNFGEPFFLVIHEGETLAEIKVRIQKKLQVPDDEFGKWKFAFLSLGRPEYLQDSDIVSSRFQRRDVYGAWEQYLGLEHTDNAPKRSYAVNQVSAFFDEQSRHTFEKPVKIYN
ncbi:hypothetical protein V8G54_032393, partial [Vigna mungo]